MNSRPILLLIIVVVFLLKLFQLLGNSGLYPLWSQLQGASRSLLGVPVCGAVCSILGDAWGAGCQPVGRGGAWAAPQSGQGLAPQGRVCIPRPAARAARVPDPSAVFLQGSLPSAR